jgi:SAM-dependent methyltransferase
VRDVFQGGGEQARNPLQPKTFSGGSLDHRWRAIAPFVAGRSVLDLGCATGHWRDDWLHARIAGAASEVLGVDIDPTLCEQVKEKGFDVVLADAEELHLDRRFEVVHAGELIEHLGSPGALLESVKRHLAPGGVFLLTTPNAFGIANFVYRLGNRSVRMNRDHVCWYCEDTLRQLFDRYGYEVEVRFLAHETPGRVRRAAARVSRVGLPDRLRWNRLFAIATPR